MMTPKIFESEYRFCLILWREEPISCSDMAKKCKDELGWSRTTSYTVIKRLAERGVLKNESSIIESLVSKEEVQLSEMNELFEKTFEKSLPAFIAAFANHQKLTDKEVEEIKRIIEKQEEGTK
ncbi:MAG: BlaI/MecI/CopY family transcriptional regulator [Lachnospiraceae bacterium]|nr:BlaI/MecI/CopY family transcriptional regulator [Lachnospiraceae bacterium]